MRFFVSALIVALALTGSAFAGNIALSSIGATASCGGTGGQACFLTGYGPAGAIDGYSAATLWVAPGSSLSEPANTYVPYLEVGLIPTGYTTVDWVTASGWGTYGLQITYDIFVGTDSTETDYINNTNGVITQSFSGGCATVGNCAEIATNVTIAGNGNYNSIPGQWTSSQYSDSLAATDYIFYIVTASQADQAGHTVGGGYDDAYVSEITADDPNVPEPGTFGLLGAGLLALGFARRSRKYWF